MLEQRARALWDARIKKDWKTAFEFVDPQIAAESNVEKYSEWCNNSEPFMYESYTLHEVVSEGRYGWAHVTYAARIRQFPKMPPREADQWQKWRVQDGKWYPVLDARAMESCPAPPALRNVAAEPALRARFEEAGKLRDKKDWPGLMKLVDPNDLEGMTPEAFAKEQERLSVLTQRVEWLQALGDNGMVFVVYNVKLNDPSMTNLPATDTPLIENWVLRDGVWYRDLRRPKADSEPTSQPAAMPPVPIPGRGGK